MSMDYRTFANPPKAFRSSPFWSLNDLLDPAEVKRQLGEFKKGGYGGAYLHSRIGLLTKYLGDDWWKAMDAGVEACDRLDLEAWFYDEDKWPSGFAGGIVPLQSEDFHARALVRLERGAPLPEKSEVLAEDAQYRYISYKRRMGEPWYNGTTWVDLMNPAMVRAFLACSYRPYAERYARKFGGTCQGIFTDEPQVSPGADNVAHRGLLSYSPFVREAFRARWGYDFADHVASLFEDTGDYRAVRLHYWRTVAKCFEESFSRQIGDFCAKTGMVWTGHFNAEESLVSVLLNVGNMMCHYRHMQRPGIDHLALRIAGGLNAARSCSSVANQYGLARRLSEMFGISGQNMNFEDRKWIADWHAVLGINHACPHLALYSMKGCRKRDYPPTLSPQQPWWPCNKMLEDHMARTSYASTVGDYAPEVLVLHPLESAYLEQNTAIEGYGSPRGDRYHKVLEALQAAHRDYDLGDEEILGDAGSVDGAVLRVGRMTYRAAVLPYMTTIRPRTLELLEKFAAAGGPVLAVGEFPALVDAREDGVVLARLKRMCRTVAPARLGAALAAALPPAVRIVGKDAGQVWIHRRTVPGGQLVLLTNTSRLKTIDCTVFLPEMRRPVLWDPQTGKCHTLRAARGRVDLQFAPAQTFILTTGKASAGAKTEGVYAKPGRATTVLALPGPWAGKRLDPNALTLDFARYSTDGGRTFSKPEPVLGIHERFTRDRWSGPLALAFDVAVDAVPAAASLVLEQPEMYNAVTVNERPVRFEGAGFYRDRSFRTADVSGLLRPGANTILLALDYVAPVPDSLDAYERYGSEIESIYLVGEFGVRATPSAEPPGETERNLRGFLPRRPIHRLGAFALAAEADTFGGDLVPAGYPFYAGRFQLERTFEMKAVSKKSRYFLAFPAVEAVVVEAELNGKRLPPLAWSPMEIDVTGALRPGTNRLHLVLTNSLRNLLGPHHHAGGELTGVGPDSFGGSGSWCAGARGEGNWYDVRLSGKPGVWRDDYHCIPFGLLEPVRLIRRG